MRGEFISFAAFIISAASQAFEASIDLEQDLVALGVVPAKFSRVTGCPLVTVTMAFASLSAGFAPLSGFQTIEHPENSVSDLLDCQMNLSVNPFFLA